MLDVFLMEVLGLRPDLKTQRLQLLPDRGPDTYIYA